MEPFLRKLGIELPIIQAPMAGVSTPEMAAAVSNAGAVGSLGVAAVDAGATRQMIAAVRARTERPFQVNVFCHKPAVADAAREASWLARLEPHFTRYDAKPPACLTEIYPSFLTDDAKLAVLLAERPAIVSFHFGVPARERIEALRAAGIVLLATATNLEEGKVIAAAGIDAVVAQGYEAGGHRGVFDPDGADDQLGTVALTRLLVRKLDLPVIAAGGIMDGAGIAASLTLGAAAAQLNKLEGLQSLDLPSDVTDAGLKELKGLKELRSLSLSGTKVTDAGLKELKEFKGLQRLYLGNAKYVTDAGLKELHVLKRLKLLDLRGTKVTDVGLKDLKELTALRSLNLAHTEEVTEEGVKALKELKELQVLDLSHNFQVSNAWIREIKELKGLKSLNLWRTRITDIGKAELHEALPKCDLHD